MAYIKDDCCVLNAGNGSWAFDPLAEQLSEALGIEIAAKPRAFNYVLSFDGALDERRHQSFIPQPAITLAADKRLLAAAFSASGVSTPRTLLLDTFAEVSAFLSSHHDTLWCLKYPTGCGGSGHRLVNAESIEPPRWPRPFVVQEFIPLPRPEVYRIYCAGGQLFGWVVRRFPEGRQSSPWVAHARGARYEQLGKPPEYAQTPARAALLAAGLMDSFGCADLLQRPNGDWVVLEVGTDGLFNHVDRNLEIPLLEQEISDRIAAAFWKRPFTSPSWQSNQNAPSHRSTLRLRAY